MTREALVALLAAHEAADAEEEADLARMREWAVSLEQPFSRDQPEAHFTASAIVVDGAGERTLLVHHRKSGKWFQPGGHLEPGDATAGDGALREAAEETGLTVRLARPELLDADVHWVPWDEHYHLDLRFHVLAAGELAPDAAEVHAAEWLTWDEAFARIDEPALRRALGKIDGRPAV
ncbi:MAG TPA: NUDIX domain-containing protein [Gaiellaceae bacterium]|nr:NUDIX domain-containing protein [Gaiellaceae bacterium]